MTRMPSDSEIGEISCATHCDPTDGTVHSVEVIEAPEFARFSWRILDAEEWLWDDGDFILNGQYRYRPVGGEAFCLVMQRIDDASDV